MDVQQENQLIARIQSGSTEDFERLVRIYQDPLFRIISNLVHPAHQLEDLVQDVFLAAFANIKQFDPNRGKFRTWLYAIARHRALNARLKRREGQLPAGLDLTDKRTPMDDLIVKEAFSQLDHALSLLKFRDRMIFVLAELEGLPYADIASVEKIPIGTVKSRLARVRIKLRRALQAYKPRPCGSPQTLVN